LNYLTWSNIIWLIISLYFISLMIFSLISYISLFIRLILCLMLSILVYLIHYFFIFIFQLLVVKLFHLVNRILSDRFLGLHYISDTLILCFVIFLYSYYWDVVNILAKVSGSSIRSFLSSSFHCSWLHLLDSWCFFSNISY